MDACLFCQIVAKKIPARVSYEDESVLAFSDIHPQAPVHEVIIPKKHWETLLSVPPEEKDFFSRVIRVVENLVKAKGLAERGFRLVNNTLTEGGQTVLHLHFHFLAGRAMQWPPG